MFVKKNKTMAKINEVESPNVNLIASGTTIQGDIKTNGDIRIDGTMIGAVDAKGKVVIGTTGRVEGEVICQNGDFSGTIKAKVRVMELLTLTSSARLTGDIITNKLSIEPGAKFTGTCSMDDSAQNKQKIVTNQHESGVKEKKYQPA